MKNYVQLDSGKLEQLNQYVFSPESMPVTVSGKLFLKDKLELTSMEVSLNKDMPGTGIDFFHSHKNNEELYIFVGGEGQMAIDDDIINVKEGSVVNIKPEAKRAWWNTGKNPLYYIVIQAPFGKIGPVTIDDAVIFEETLPWT